MVKTKKRETNPRSTYDAISRKFARKALDVMKSMGLLEGHAEIFTRSGDDRISREIGNVRVQGRLIPIMLVAYRDDHLNGIVPHGSYARKSRHGKEEIEIVIDRPLYLEYAQKVSPIYEGLVEIVRHEIQHAIQKPEEWRPISHKDVQLGYGSLSSFKHHLLNNYEIDAYAAGIYASAKKSRKSFYDDLSGFRSSVISRYPDIDKKLIDRFIVRVHERAIVLYPELLKQKPIPKKRAKRERKAKVKRAMEGRRSFGTDTDPRLSRIIVGLAGELGAYTDDDERRRFISKAIKYARQPGFDGEAAFRSFMDYILIRSKYSAHRSVGKTDYPKRRSIQDTILKVARLISGKGSRSALNKVASEVARQAEAAKIGSKHSLASAGATVAMVAAAAAAAPAHTTTAVEDSIRYGKIASLATGTDHDDYLVDCADGLLRIMRREAERARRRANPAKRKTAKKKPAKKKAASKKTPPYQLLINRCQKLWDHYCERPSKSRLKPILEHLEKMKASTSKKVDAERARCLRVANKEAKRLKMK